MHPRLVEHDFYILSVVTGKVKCSAHFREEFCFGSPPPQYNPNTVFKQKQVNSSNVSSQTCLSCLEEHRFLFSFTFMNINFANTITKRIKINNKKTTNKMNSYPYECKIGVRCFCSHFHCLCCFVVVVVARFLLSVQDVGRCLVLYFTYRLIRVQVEFASIVIITMHASWSLFYHMYFVQLIAHKRNGNSAGKRGIPSRERQEKKNIIWKILIII